MVTLADVIVSDPDAEGAASNSDPRNKSTEPANRSPSNENDLPEKFRGKSVRDVVEMYTNLESRLGSMSNELGVQRQLSDRLLGLKREEDLRANGGRPTQPQPKPVTASDFLAEPQETLERAIDYRVSRAIEPLRNENLQLRVAQARAQFESRHSDWQNTMAEPAFVSWVQATPIRRRAATVANNGDWYVADELFTEYELSKANAAATRSDRLDDARRASFTSGGTANGSAETGRPKGKIFRRSELIRLKMENPEAYEDEDFQRELLEAYQEGRVR